MNIAVRFALAGLIFLGVIGFRFIGKGNTGKEARAVAHQIVAEADCYAANKEYMDWLADNAHDEVFDKSYHMDYSRRGNRSYLDGDVYITKLFDNMIETAKAANAKQVAESLERLRKGDDDPKAAKKDAPQPVKQLGEK